MGNHLTNHHRRSLGIGGRIGGNGMRRITLIVIHCTSTRADIDFTQADLLRCHLSQGMRCIGYHFYIRKDGYIHGTRPLEQAGAHARGYNRESIGIAYEGGLDERGHPADTRTQKQKYSMRALIRVLKQEFTVTRVCGHRDLSPAISKECPCFDVEGDEWCS